MQQVPEWERMVEVKTVTKFESEGLAVEWDQVGSYRLLPQSAQAPVQGCSLRQGNRDQSMIWGQSSGTIYSWQEKQNL